MVVAEAGGRTIPPGARVGTFTHSRLERRVGPSDGLPSDLDGTEWIFRDNRV